MRGADRVSSFVLVVFALVGVNEARKLRFGTLSSPGPGFVPLCLAVALALVGCLLLWRALREPESPEPSAEPGARWKSVVSLAALVAYTFALEPLGFVLATAALLFFFFRVLDGQRWWVALASAVAVSMLSYLVFARALHVRLPEGPWS
ncbi:MAG TPA: tripartite tricarboxylate transporter TctB family protein [Methylomirabilota bacterium]